MKFNIVFPVLNEDERLIRGVSETVKFLDSLDNFPYVITIVDNGSDSEHQKIGKDLSDKYADVEYMYLDQKGVGLAFRSAILKNNCDIIGYMDVDLSTPLENLIKTKNIFCNDTNISVVNASRHLKESKIVGRKPLREITSRGLNFILKFLFRVKFTDSMVGFKFYRKSVANELVSISSDDNGWFYCAEMLIRTEQNKIKIKEIPVVWTDNPDTKVNVNSLIKNYLKRICALFKEIVLGNKE